MSIWNGKVDWEMVNRHAREGLRFLDVPVKQDDDPDVVLGYMQILEAKLRMAEDELAKLRAGQ